VDEYIDRKRMARLGFTSSLESLPAWKVDVFTAIDVRVEELQKRDTDKVKKKK
jgi:hypothetical protein